MTKPDGEPMLDIARGDAARSRQLRESLKIIRDRTDDPAFRQLVNDVLDGKRGLRDAARSSLFGQAVAPRMQQALERFNQLPEEERERMAAEGERQLDRLREQIQREKDRQQAPSQRQARSDEDDEEPPGGFMQDAW